MLINLLDSDQVESVPEEDQHENGRWWAKDSKQGSEVPLQSTIFINIGMINLSPWIRFRQTESDKRFPLRLMRMQYKYLEQHNFNKPSNSSLFSVSSK